MNKITNTSLKPIHVLGVPSDLGANKRGSKMGPGALRMSELHPKLEDLGYLMRDLGDIEVPIRETLSTEQETNKYQSVISMIARKVCETALHTLEQGASPLLLGGDHSVVLGSVAATSAWARSSANSDIGLLWIDAHADMNTHATSPTGNIHGMPLAASLGLGVPELTSEIGQDRVKVKPENTVLLGIRSVDPKEKELCQAQGVRIYTMREIDERGLSTVMREAIGILTRNTLGYHVSFGIDAVDPMHAPGVSTPVNGGLSEREAHLTMEMISDSGKALALDFVELNPMTDVDHRTANLAVELIQSFFGKSII